MVMATAPATPCPICKGEGSYLDMVQWSDGPGMAGHRCSLCDGTGQVRMPLDRLALFYKSLFEETDRRLNDLKVQIALVFSEQDRAPIDPPLKDAPAPGNSYGERRKRLDAMIAELPRVKPGDCGHTDPAICRANIDKYPTSALASGCAVTAGIPQADPRVRRPF